MIKQTVQKPQDDEDNSVKTIRIQENTREKNTNPMILEPKNTPVVESKDRAAPWTRVSPGRITITPVIMTVIKVNWPKELDRKTNNQLNKRLLMIFDDSALVMKMNEIMILIMTIKMAIAVLWIK